MFLVTAVVAVACAGLSASGSSAAIPRFGHAFLIVGENTSYEQITPAHAPFLTGTVKAQGAWLTNSHSFVKSSSLGQYIAMVSGQYTACEANNDLPDHCHQRSPEPLLPAHGDRTRLARLRAVDAERLQPR